MIGVNASFTNATWLVEEVCFGGPLILRSKQAARGDNPLYYALVRSESGRYLFKAFIKFKHGRAMVVTARDMNQVKRAFAKPWACAV